MSERAVKGRQNQGLRQHINFWRLKKGIWRVAVKGLAKRGNSTSFQFPRFALSSFFLVLYHTSGKNHLSQFFRWYSCRAVIWCSGFLRALQSSSNWQPYTKLTTNKIQQQCQVAIFFCGSGLQLLTDLVSQKTPHRGRIFFSPFQSRRF